MFNKLVQYKKYGVCIKFFTNHISIVGLSTPFNSVKQKKTLRNVRISFFSQSAFLAKNIRRKMRYLGANINLQRKN